MKLDNDSDGRGAKNNVSQVIAKVFVLVLAVIVTTELLVTFAGYVGSVNYLEVTADYRHYQIVLGAVCLAGALAVRFFRVWQWTWLPLTAGVGIIIGINGLEVFPVVFSHPREAQTAQGIRFKAIAFNVESSNQRFAETREFVAREAPDVAMFCEAEKPWPEELSELATILPHHVLVEAMGIEVFSRLPIVRTQVFNFGPERGFVAIGIKGENADLTFVAVHTYSRFWRHAEGYRQRTLALEQGLGTQSKSFSRPVLAMGDFNASQWTPAYKSMLARSGLRDAQQGFGLIQTQHDHATSWLWRPIDHCLHSDELFVSNFRTGPDLGSDHLPVIVDGILSPGTFRSNGRVDGF